MENTTTTVQQQVADYLAQLDAAFDDLDMDAAGAVIDALTDDGFDHERFLAIVCQQGIHRLAEPSGTSALHALHALAGTAPPAPAPLDLSPHP